MLISVLWNELKIDTGDDSIGFFSAKRGFERASAVVNKDLGTAYAVTGEDEDDSTITPDPAGRDKECLLLLAAHFLARVDLARVSNLISWKSGDKEVDRSRQNLTKKEILDNLWSQYRHLAGLDDDPGCSSAAVFEITGGDPTEEKLWNE